MSCRRFPLETSLLLLAGVIAAPLAMASPSVTESEPKAKHCKNALLKDDSAKELDLLKRLLAREDVLASLTSEEADLIKKLKADLCIGTDRVECSPE
jgi:hypothetical protein